MSEQTPAKGKSLAHLIAWLSLCLLVAGWAPNLDPQWRQVWGNAGLFGLVAAVAFVTNHHVLAWRRKRELQKQQEANRQLAERRLEQLAAEDKRMTSMVLECEEVGSAK